MSKHVDRNELPEYRDNAFIRGLPPILSTKDAYRSLLSLPSWNAGERDMSASLRRHCLLRLGRYFDPLPRHCQLLANVEMTIHQGYAGRDPASGKFMVRVRDSSRRVRTPASHRFGGFFASDGATATSSALVGCSGVGKSMCVHKVMSHYEPLIVHNRTFRCHQLPYVMLDCPHRGSENVLCDSFFVYVDRVVGTDYYARYGGDRRQIGGKLLAMAHVACLHAVGLLIIDEIQHLRAATGGPEALLNFMVTLENTIGVPVLLIGTLGALDLLQGSFRQARRGCGFGSMVWERMTEDGGEWAHWASRLWSFQWTRTATEWTPELSSALYDESQGIKDVAIKLYTMTQIRAMTAGEASKGADELISPQMIRAVAREEFQLIRPMIEALRRHDTEALLAFDDLLPLQEHFKLLLRKTNVNPEADRGAAALAMSAKVGERVQPPPQADVPGPLEQLHAETRKTLKSLGIADDVAEAALARAILEVPGVSPLELMAVLMRMLAEERASTTRRRRMVGKPTADPEVAAPDPRDLREIVRLGAAGGLCAHAAIANAGLAMDPSRVAEVV